MSKTRCPFCGSGLHTRDNCSHTGSGNARRVKLRCSYCGATGHNSNACPHNASSANRRRLNDDYYLD